MKLLLKVISVGLLLSGSVQAEMLPEMPRVGNYVIKDNNIVAINGKTMVKNSKTVLYDCSGNRVKALYTGASVTFTLQEDETGPVPVLAEVREICS